MCDSMFWKIIAALFVIGFLVFAFSCLYAYYLIHMRQIQTARYEINVRSTVDNTIVDTLDKIIEDSFMDYQVIVLIPKGEEYITPDREKEIRDDLIYKVSERISPEALEKLSQFYNANNMDKVIADKIYITVMNYAITKNQVIESEGKNL